MEKPIQAAKVPKLVTLEPGIYFWCACGRSKNQPFCDSSHKGTGLFSLSFKIDERKDAWLCMCKQSKNKPFCDGTHKIL